MKKKGIVVRRKKGADIWIMWFFFVLAIVVIVGELTSDNTNWVNLYFFVAGGMLVFCAIFAQYYWAVKVNRNEIIVRKFLKRPKKHSINQVKFVRIQSRTIKPPMPKKKPKKKQDTHTRRNDIIASVYSKNKCIICVESSDKGYDEFLDFLLNNNIKMGNTRGTRGDVTENIALKGSKILLGIGVFFFVLFMSTLWISILEISPSGIIISLFFMLVVALTAILHGLRWKMLVHGNTVILRKFKKEKTYELNQLEVILKHSIKSGIFFNLYYKGKHLTVVHNTDIGFDEFFNYLLWREIPIIDKT
ncbi:MAG: hypothetical protein FWC89_01845 [Defluviitaleaceae bacterium]|nr:hypothetical protein [Defluviitaleaceae bacterium]